MEENVLRDLEHGYLNFFYLKIVVDSVTGCRQREGEVCGVQESLKKREENPTARRVEEEIGEVETGE